MTEVSSSFPFSKLPPELRRRILLQTDLVTPRGYVAYSGGKLYALPPALEEPRIERYTQNNESEGSNHVEATPQKTDYKDQWDPEWASPEALFLVSRAFSALAQSVLLSENHFVARGGLPSEGYEYLSHIDGGPAWEEAFHLNAATSQAARFVSTAPRCDFLASLRFLEIGFPSSYGDTTKPSGAVLQWQRAVQRFSQTLNPRRLIMHIKGDKSIPILETIFRTDPLVFPKDDSERHELINGVRGSVEIYWPLDRLARLDGVRMFLWDVDRDVEGSKLVYYCRHRDEKLPRMAGDMDIFEPRPWPIFHAQREFQRQVGRVASVEHGEQEAKQPTPWVEGIFVRPWDEDDRWTQYLISMRDAK